jgi:hypothetical protein
VTSPPDHVRELLAQSLLAWRVEGSVHHAGAAILLRTDAREIAVGPASPGVPFRWMVTVDGRTRGAISLVAVLRQVRQALDPGYAANRVRIALPVP